MRLSSFVRRALLLVGVVGALASAASSMSAEPLEPVESVDFRFVSVARAGQRVGDPTLTYRADGGGCNPRTDWYKYSETLKSPSKWWEWGVRLKDLGNKVRSMSQGQRAATVLDALSSFDGTWLQVIDGWVQPTKEGKDAFGEVYVKDMKKAQDACVELMKSKGLSYETFNYDFYGKIHNIAFENTATELSKTNGFRSSNSWIYLPCPDKPAGVFSDIHNHGKLAFNTKLRNYTIISDTSGHKYNGGYQMRWVYPNQSDEFLKNKVNEYFKKFWDTIASLHKHDYNGKLKAIALLYHNLENLHPFVDGTGRTDYLVLNTLLSWVGLHPVSLYNTMESALSSPEQEELKILEGFFRWEDAYSTQKPGWTIPLVEEKGKECDHAIAVLMGKEDPDKGEFVPDTMGGCMCANKRECVTGSGKPHCRTDRNCLWEFDECTPRTVKNAKSL